MLYWSLRFSIALYFTYVQPVRLVSKNRRIDTIGMYRKASDFHKLALLSQSRVCYNNAYYNIFLTENEEHKLLVDTIYKEIQNKANIGGMKIYLPYPSQMPLVVKEYFLKSGFTIENNILSWNEEMK